MTRQNLDTLLLTALLDATPDAIIVSDTVGTITRANAAAGRLFGHDPASLTGTPVNRLMPVALADRHDGFMKTYLETGTERIIGSGRQVEGLRSNGETFPLHLSIGRADLADKTYFVAILHDITRRIAAEEALARSARLEAVGQMTGGISHDFSNLLTVIIGNLELLDDRLTDAEDHAMIADALDAAALGADLTSRLNAFARKAPLASEPMDVNQSCEAALALIRRTFDPKFVINVQLASELPKVLADTTQLQSALINVALNARDAMPDGGRIILKSELVTIDDNYIAQELDVARGTYVRLSITDTGLGMGPDTQQRVFEPFFTTKPIGQGTGLGLAMVYGFVRQCGGHVTVYSEIGHGTTVGLYFVALTDQQTPELENNARIPPRLGQSQMVLVVEDNPQVRKLTVARIRELGYDVLEADSGDAAAVMLRHSPGIDAVFTDLVMPGVLDGLALARHVGATYPHILVLLTSGYAEDILTKEAEPLPHDILHKPYRQSELAKALEKLFKPRDPTPHEHHR